MSDDTSTGPVLVEVDQRGRVSLGKIGAAGRYLAHRSADGAVTLEPARVTSELEARLHGNQELHERIRASVIDPSKAQPTRRR